MIYYTADLHFNSYRNLPYRPFKTIGEMNAYMYMNIAQRVGRHDTLVIVGDVGSCSNPPIRILKKIKARKILIVGNNDLPPLKDREFRKCFDSIIQGNYLFYDEYLGSKIFLNHYPCCSWNGSRTGIPHFYGHIHSLKTDGYEQISQIPNAYNVGVDVLDYRPMTAKEIIEGREDIPIND